MGTLTTSLVVCLFISFYIPSNYGFNLERSRRETEGNVEGLASSWLTERVRRHEGADDHGSHKLEDYFKNHLSWLNDAQKEELKTLKAEGKSRKDLQDKVFAYYDAATGETKTKATELLQGGCRELISSVIGKENADKVKALKEGGATPEELKKKVKEYIAQVTDEHKKQIADEYEKPCEKVFGVKQSRKKRTVIEEGKLEDAFKTHLSWLTDAQKAELKTYKDDGKSFEDAQTKVFAWYAELTGDAKEKATQLLQEGCRTVIKELVGEEKAAELKTLRESGASKAAIKEKIIKLMDELTDPVKKDKALKFAGGCQKVFEIESRKKREHKIDDAKFEEAKKTYLSWLTDAQREELKTLKEEGKSFEDIQKKVFEHYGALSGEAKDKATQLLQEGCRSIIKELVGEEKANELKTLRESGAAKSAIKEKVVAFMDALTDPAKKEKALKYAGGCQKVFEIESRKKRETKIDDAKFEEAKKTYLSWLTDAQREELKTLKEEGKSFDDIQKKVFEHYGALSGEAKDKATQLLQEGCRSIIKELVGEEKANELKTLRESGAAKSAIKDKIVKFMDELTDPAKKEKALKFAGGCQKVFEIESRKKRETKIDDAKFEEAKKTYLSWLTDAQREELKTLKEEGKSFDDIQKKVFEHYGALSGEAKEKATQLLQEGCRSIIKELVGEEKANELKTLRESDAAKSAIKDKVVKFMDELTDPVKKEKALKFAGGCQKVFELESRKKRDAPQSKLDDYLKTHLSWLTDAQKEELKTLKAEGKPFSELHDKVFEHYGKLSDDAKKNAKEQMQEGCRGMIKEVAGEEAANELKKLRDSGASKSAIEAKIAEYMDKLTDEGKKETAVKYAPACKRIFDLDTTRAKRDEGQGKLEKAFTSHLSWLTEDQKQQLRTLKNEGKEFTELQAHVFKWYGELAGEDKTKATELLKGGCRELMTEILGEEKAGELKKLKESGATKEDLKTKAKELIDALTDDAQKDKAKQYAGACEKIFGVSSRKKRDHHGDHSGHGHEEQQAKLEGYFKTHLSWLTDEQKQSLKDMCMQDKTPQEMQAKVFEYYEALSGEAKEKATQLLQDGCRNLIKSLVGDEKAGELKKLKESGATKEDIEKKVQELIAGLEDDAKKKKAQEYGPACKKVFGVSRKKRSNVDSAKFEEALKTHLSWLTDAQKEEVKALHKDGKPFEDVQKKVFEFYGELSGDAKEKATQLLQEGCRSVIKDLVGEEKANELKALRESGASKAAIKEKIVKLMDELTDPEKKEKALKFAGGCQKVFEIESRKKRETKIDDAKFEEAKKTYLSWLTDAQREELKTLKEEGKSFDDIQKKVFEHYGALSGEAKDKATQLLQEGCRSIIKELVGEEKANELKTLRESGAAKSAIKDKVVAFMDALTDPAKKEKALKFAGGCQKVFELESRKKRDAPQAKLDDYLKTHLAWLTDAQKEELKTLKAEGKPFNDLQDKVFEHYGKLSDDAKKNAKEQMQEGCRGMIKEVAGEEAANELKKLRDSGASKSAIEAKIAEYMDKLTDEGKKETAVKYAPACKRIFDLDTTRAKRDHHIDADKLTEALGGYLSWLTEEQKTALKSFQAEGKDFNEVNKKVFEYYGQLSGEAQQKAKEQLQGGCRALIKELAGDEKAEELKKLKESGASKEDIKKKVVEFMDALTDEEKKKKAVKYAPSCEKIFGLDA